MEDSADPAASTPGSCVAMNVQKSVLLGEFEDKEEPENSNIHLGD